MGFTGMPPAAKGSALGFRQGFNPWTPYLAHCMGEDGGTVCLGLQLRPPEHEGCSGSLGIIGFAADHYTSILYSSAGSGVSNPKYALVPACTTHTGGFISIIRMASSRLTQR